MLTILGTLFGGLFRLAPEFLKYFDKKNERAHEATMFDKQLEADKVKAAAALALEETRGANALNLADIQAMIEATKAQAVQTGIKWVDAINALVRPGLTFWWCIVLETAVLVCSYLALRAAGKNSVESILAIWSPEREAIVASIISFWFVDRALRKMSGR